MNCNRRIQNREKTSNWERNLNLRSQTRDGHLRCDNNNLRARNPIRRDAKFGGENSKHMTCKAAHKTSALAQYDAQLQNSAIKQRGQNRSLAPSPTRRASGHSTWQYSQQGNGGRGACSRRVREGRCMASRREIQDIFRGGRGTSKIFKKFLKKIAKMHYFRIFSKNLTSHTLIFPAFWRKTQFVGNFQKFS